MGAIKGKLYGESNEKINNLSHNAHLFVYFLCLLLVLCAIGYRQRCDSNVVSPFEKQKLIFIAFTFFLTPHWQNYEVAHLDSQQKQLLTKWPYLSIILYSITITWNLPISSYTFQKHGTHTHLNLPLIIFSFKENQAYHRPFSAADTAVCIDSPPSL